MTAPLYPVYYDSRRAFLEHFETVSRQSRVRATTPAALRGWQKRARGTLVKLLGLERISAGAARAHRTEAVDCGDYRRERWLMQTQRHVWMPFHVLSPKTGKKRLPAVICPHGHCGGGKAAVAGVAVHPDVTRAMGEFNYAYGVQFVRAGFRVFCPDARGQGERQEVESRNAPCASSCHELQLMGAPLGIPVAGMLTFDLQRLADHILGRKDVLPDRLGCAGLSGGGLQTLYFAAVDRRVTCAIISGYFYGVRDSLLNMPNNCTCNLVPGLWEHFDMGDIGALIAPRPLLIETGDADSLNGRRGTRNVREQVAISRTAYQRLAASDCLAHEVFAGPHRWHGGRVAEWMRRGLLGNCEG